ncbi:MAG: hypothetical protein ACKOSQ_00150 [Planctomycetaceae bacterium]
MPRMEDTLDPIVSDKLAAGGILAALKVARWCLSDPDSLDGRQLTPPALHFAMGMLRRLVWDAVDDAADVNRAQHYADAVIEALGLTGALDRIHAIDHHWRRGSIDAGELVDVVDRQLTGAITRLTAALAESSPASN